MIGAVELARIACGGFFLAGLLTGVWKYRHIMASAEAQAPVYVDICHRAALMYAFACLLLAEFARLSDWTAAVNLVGVALSVVFFAAAVASYAAHGVLQDTDNQLRRPHRLGARTVHGDAMNIFILALAAGEIGGFLLLFTGYLHALR